MRLSRNVLAAHTNCPIQTYMNVYIHIYIYDRETFRDYLPSLFLSLIYIGFK